VCPVLPFPVNRTCSASSPRQFRQLFRSRSLNNIPRRRLLVRIVANLGLRPHGHLSACPQHPTQSGPWIRSLPLRAYSVEDGRLRVAHRNQAARTRLASKYYFRITPFESYAALHPLCTHLSTCFTPIPDSTNFVIFFPPPQLSPLNHQILSLISLTQSFLPSMCLHVSLFPVNVPDGI